MVGDEASFRIEGIVVGRGALGTRLGYDRADIRGPWLLKTLFGWLHRHARYVAWEDVAALSNHKIVVTKAWDDLPEPPNL
jgi:hypothetical protein